MDKKFVIQLAILSRVLIIIVQALSNYFVSGNDVVVVVTDEINAFISPKPTGYNGSVCHSVIERVFGGFRRWDAEFFLHIAEHGYTYENTLVFYPLFPFCVRYVTQFAQSYLGIGCEFCNLSLLVAVVLNIIFFTNAVLVLHELTIDTFNNKRLARTVTTLFCFNPASIFFSAPYTESLFCWLAFSVMLHCTRNQFRAAVLPLALGLWCRLNGLLNFGFILYYVTRDIWRKKNNRNCKKFFKGLLKVLLSALVAGVAFIVVQAYYYSLYCQGNHFKMNEAVRKYGNKNDYLLVGDKKAEWCSFSPPFSYSYLQERYWDIGFLAYYELKQIPNFTLASPILIMIISHAIQFLWNNPRILLSLGLTRTNGKVDDENQFVYVVHALALSVFCLCFVHIQVSTRMLASASPYIYWICAQHFHEERQPNLTIAFLQPKSRITKFIKAWFLGYFVIGTVLFSNFLPWT